jgi:hypothetical protein
VGYFTRFLNSPDATVAEDALFELRRAPRRTAAAAIDEETHSQLSQLVADDAVHPTQRGFCAELLGLIGTDADRQMLRGRALQSTAEVRVDAPGLMSGYLVLAGEDGLRELEQQKLTPGDLGFSERYAAMQAIHFCHKNAPERIPAARLGQALQILLDDPDCCDLVLRELPFMNDWSAVEEISRLYEIEAFRQPGTVRAMIRYLHYAAHPEYAEHIKPTAAQQEQAARQLKIFRDREAKQYAGAMRFVAPPKTVTP